MTEQNLIDIQLTAKVRKLISLKRIGRPKSVIKRIEADVAEGVRLNGATASRLFFTANPTKESELFADDEARKPGAFRSLKLSMLSMASGAGTRRKVNVSFYSELSKVSKLKIMYFYYILHHYGSYNLSLGVYNEILSYLSPVSVNNCRKYLVEYLISRSAGSVFSGFNMDDNSDVVNALINLHSNSTKVQETTIDSLGITVATNVRIPLAIKESRFTDNDLAIAGLEDITENFRNPVEADVEANDEDYIRSSIHEVYDIVPLSIFFVNDQSVFNSNDTVMNSAIRGLVGSENFIESILESNEYRREWATLTREEILDAGAELPTTDASVMSFINSLKLRLGIYGFTVIKSDGMSIKAYHHTYVGNNTTWVGMEEDDGTELNHGLVSFVIMLIRTTSNTFKLKFIGLIHGDILKSDWAGLNYFMDLNTKIRENHSRFTCVNTRTYGEILSPGAPTRPVALMEIEPIFSTMVGDPLDIAAAHEDIHGIFQEKKMDVLDFMKRLPDFTVIMNQATREKVVVATKNMHVGIEYQRLEIKARLIIAVETRLTQEFMMVDSGLFDMTVELGRFSDVSYRYSGGVALF